MLGLGINIWGGQNGALFSALFGMIDPVPDFLLHYKLDGIDFNLTRVGGNDFRIGPECNEAIASWYDNSSQYDDAAPDSAKVAVGTGALSVGAWINTKNASVVGTIFASGTGNIGDGTFEFSYVGSNKRLRFRSESTNVITTATLGDGEWHRVDYVSDGAGLAGRFYVDGVLDATVTSPNYDIQDTGGLAVGARGGSFLNIFDGGLDGVRFYDRALSAPEIATLYSYRCDFNPSIVTTSLWLDGRPPASFTQVGGAVATWFDKSGNGNDTTQSNGALQPNWDIDTGEVSFVNGDSLQKLNQVNMLDLSGEYTMVCIHDILDPSTSTQSFLNIFNNTSDAGAGLNRRPYLFYERDTDELGPANSEFSATTITASNFAGNQVLSSDIENGGNHSVYVGGALEASTSAVIDTSVISTALRVGDLNVQNLPIKYKEIVFIAGPKDTDKRQKIEGDLAWKWFPTTSKGSGNPALDANHPYKFQPPKSFWNVLIDDEGNILEDDEGNELGYYT